MSDAYVATEKRIQEAMDAYGTCEKTTIASLAREFEVPEQRLRKRCQGRPCLSDRVGNGRRLTIEQERALCQYLDRLDTIGTCARYSMVACSANLILASAHQDATSASSTVGPKWPERFLQRHPEYKIRKQKTLNINRKIAHQPDDIGCWFRKFQEERVKNGVSDVDIYNMDETGFSIGMGKNPWVVTKTPEQAYLASSNNREYLTVVECISGDGAFLPPMVIIPGVMQMESWFTKTHIPDDYLVATSESGYSNDVLTMEWLRHFEKFSRQRQVGTHRLLILDGYGSHCTLEFIQFCDDHKIIPFCLPAHTTHLLQPLDVVIFQPYRHWHAEALDAATRSGCHDYNKIEFLHALPGIRTKALKHRSILSSFRCTGLIPYNPFLVLDQLRERNNITPPPTSSHPMVTYPSTPLTIRTLSRQGSYLKHADPRSPSFPDRLQLFVKGSIIMATAGDLAAQGLAQTEAAQAARRLRSKKTRRSLQRGGVMYAREARHMAQEREENDVHKAQAALNRAKAKEHRKEKLEWQPIVRLAKGRLAQGKKQRAQRERQMKAICRQIQRKVAIVF